MVGSQSTVHRHTTERDFQESITDERYSGYGY